MKLKFDFNKLGWKSGLLLVAGLILVAVAINEVSNYFTRQNLVKEFEIAASKTKSVDELDQVVGQFAPKYIQIQNLSLFSNQKVGVNLGEAYDPEEDYGDDQQPRDKFTEPKFDCELALRNLIQAKQDLNDLLYLTDGQPLTPEIIAKFNLQQVIDESLPTARYQYYGQLNAYLTKCLNVKILPIDL